MHDPLGAFVPGIEVHRPGRPNGPLAGLTFAAKDLFDIAGLVTGCGNPDWAATHAPATQDAWAVATLIVLKNSEIAEGPRFFWTVGRHDRNSREGRCTCVIFVWMISGGSRRGQ